MKKLRVVVMTSIACGTASRVLPALLASDKLVVAGAILIVTPKTRRFRLKRKKIQKIGLLGALNGLRLRRWYAETGLPDLRTLCAEAGVPCIETDSTNGLQTRDAMMSFDADLGLSLGNSYIHPRIFSIPRFGMINVHTELLPDFKGAQSVIWAIYEGRTTSGFTIHQISESIDGGDILFREELPIQFLPSLKATVRRMMEATGSRVPAAVRMVCEKYDELQKSRTSQTSGRSYTTPSISQFLRMVINHRRLRAAGSH